MVVVLAGVAGWFVGGVPEGCSPDGVILPACSVGTVWAGAVVGVDVGAVGVVHWNGLNFGVDGAVGALDDTGVVGAGEPPMGAVVAGEVSVVPSIDLP